MAHDLSIIMKAKPIYITPMTGLTTTISICESCVLLNVRWCQRPTGALQELLLFPFTHSFVAISFGSDSEPQTVPDCDHSSAMVLS